MPVEFNEVQQRFSPWVIESLKKNGIEDATVEVTGMTEKGDNYMGDVLFAVAKGKNSDRKDVTLHLVIKKNKENHSMESTWDSSSVYLRENAVYERIFPAFEKFQIEKNVGEIFDSVPKCYGVLNEENCQAILMENLKESGYELHDRFVNMDSKHIEFVLYNYAKFHAVSFAMRDQDRERFDELTNDMGYLFRKMLADEGMRKWYESNTKRIMGILEEADPVLAEKFQKKMEKGLINMMLNLGDAQIEECVVTHGDCWNNNFMFKYENPLEKSPTKVAILDWQLSMLHSPVMDLSYFLHIVSSTQEVAKFNEFLRYYHKNLSNFIRALGSDPTKLFPYSTLLEHWEKYSYYGISILITSLELMTCDKDDAIDMSEFKTPEDVLEAWTMIKPKNFELYRERVLANIRQYCEGIQM